MIGELIYVNEMIQEMTDRFKIDHRKTTPYHPQINGQTERVNRTLVSILHKTIHDSKRDWDVKLTAALWAYRTTFKVTTQATPFSLVYRLEATLPIEFEVESLRIVVDARLRDSQSLRNRLKILEELDEQRRMSAQHIEAIQRRRKITFNKRHKKQILTPGMMVMIQDARKLEFPGKFDVVWLGLYLVREAFPNNSLQLDTLNGESFQRGHQVVGARNTRHEVTLAIKQEILDPIPDGRQLCEPKFVLLCVFYFIKH